MGRSHDTIVWVSHHSARTGTLISPRCEGITVWNASCRTCLCWLGEAETRDQAEHITCPAGSQQGEA